VYSVVPLEHCDPSPGSGPSQFPIIIVEMSAGLVVGGVVLGGVVVLDVVVLDVVVLDVVVLVTVPPPGQAASSTANVATRQTIRHLFICPVTSLPMANIMIRLSPEPLRY
jgi:hypothetical protein